MTILKGDVVFARGGEPVRIASKDKATGNVTYERDFGRVQEATRLGVKNGLSAEQGEAFRTVLTEVRDADAKAEIDKLAARVEQLRKEGADPRLLRYLKGELQFRMTSERHQPQGYEVDEMTLLSS